MCAAPLHRVLHALAYGLRGVELPAAETTRRSIGHSHVLPPRLRSFHGGHATLHRMLQKACLRLRAMDYFTGQLSLGVKFGFELGWGAETHCFPTQDSVVLGKLLNQLWAQQPEEAPEPTKVSITLSRLEPIGAHTPSLFVEDKQARRMELQHAMDKVNKRFGGRTIYYAEAMEAQRSREAAPMRIAFNHIPELELECDQNLDKKAPGP